MNESSIIVKTEIGAEHKTFERLDVNESVSEKSPYVQAVVAVEIKLTQRILTVTHAAYGTRESDTVDFIYRHCRSHLERVFKRLTIDLGGMGKSEILAYGNYLADIERCIDASRDILKIGMLEDTGIFLIAKGEEHRATVGSR